MDESERGAHWYTDNEIDALAEECEEHWGLSYSDQMDMIFALQVERATRKLLEHDLTEWTRTTMPQRTDAELVALILNWYKAKRQALAAWDHHKNREPYPQNNHTLYQETHRIAENATSVECAHYKLLRNALEAYLHDEEQESPPSAHEGEEP